MSKQGKERTCRGRSSTGMNELIRVSEDPRTITSTLHSTWYIQRGKTITVYRKLKEVIFPPTIYAHYC